MVKVLAKWIKNNIPDYQHMTMLDPCSGTGVIHKGLSGLFYRIKYFDKYTGVKKGNFLLHNKKYDIISMNPPYSQKYKFMDKAFRQARFVFVLYPLNTLNYLVIHEKYEDKPEYVGFIKMSPKMLLDETLNPKQGGNSMYCWLIWDSHKTSNKHEFWLEDLREYI